MLLHGLELRSLDVVAPTMDDAFVQLVGRRAPHGEPEIEA